MERRLFPLSILCAVALGIASPANAQDVSEVSEPQRLVESDAEFRQCTLALKKLGARFAVSDPVLDDDDAQCGILRPVIVSQAAHGVQLNPPGPMRCATALALAEWVDTFVVPASRNLPERGLLTQINQSSPYVCRRRNNLPTGKLSEHAFGNALDISSFEFAEGRPIPVEPREREGTPAEAFQRAVRASACLNFTTVLGPGTDSSHDDHLHLDIKARRGGFRLCQ
ncbi:MAG: extensin family protein [Alphaproteobacteria bacterium]|nr:extensin family protein [Alphaproteobacteria bacterium]